MSLDPHRIYEETFQPLYDHHTHHERCGHARGTMKDYIEQAIQNGARAIGLSDHSPIYHIKDHPHALPGTAMSQTEFPHYFAEMTELRESYRDTIDIRLGVEADYILDWDDHYRALLQQYDFDYVIGSVHWIGGWNIFHENLPKKHTKESIFEVYLESIRRATESGIYDIVGHFDAIKTRGHMPAGDFEADIRRVMEAIAEADMSIELNTSGWRKSCDEQYPSRAILEKALDCGVSVVLGSDAHDPHLVGADFDRALALLKDIGFTQIAHYERRKRIMTPITDGM